MHSPTHDTPDRPARADPQTSERRWRLARTFFHAGLGALLALYVAFFVIKCATDIRFPYFLDYGEGLILSQALRLAHGQTLYNDYTHYPFVVSNYPPVYVALVALGMKVFGVQYAFGRALAFAAMVGVAVMMGTVLRRGCGASLAAAIGAPAFFLSNLFVTLWAGFMRVDSLALLLVMGGLYCLLQRSNRLIPAVLLMAVAFYTKQSMVLGVAAGAVYLWWMGERRAAALFAGSWAAIVLVVFAVFEVLTHGWFYRHVVTANANPWLREWAWELIGMTLKRWPVLIAMAAITAVVLLIGARKNQRCGEGDRKQRCERLLVPYFLFAALGFLTVGKAGATVNYAIEPMAAALLVAALGYDRVRAARPLGAARLLWPVTALALSAQAVGMWSLPSRFNLAREQATQGEQAAARIFAQTKGEIIGEPVGILVANGRPVLLDPASFSQMYLAGVWDPTQLIEDIRRQRFALVFTSFDPYLAPDRAGTYGFGRWSGRIMRAVLSRYRLSSYAGTVFFLKPIPGKGTPSPPRERAGAGSGGRETIPPP